MNKKVALNKELSGFLKEDKSLCFQMNCSFKDEQRTLMRIFNLSVVIFDSEELKGHADKGPHWKQGNVVLTNGWANNSGIDSQSSRTHPTRLSPRTQFFFSWREQ